MSILAMFYYTLGNIRPELRSTHRAIQLIACVTSPNLEKYGFEAVLRPFMEDVNTLREVCIIVSYRITLFTRILIFYHVIGRNFNCNAWRRT